MVSVAKQAVVGPIRGGRSNGHHGNIVDDEHYRRENRKSKPAVGDDAVNLVGSRKLFARASLAARPYDFGDVDVALVCDYAFGVVVKLLFGGLYVAFNVLQNSGRNFERFDYLFVALENFYREPALLFFRHFVKGGFLYVGYGVLHGACKFMLGNGPRPARGLDSLLGGLKNASSLQR